jgi:glycine hydroxymethyltransferase
MKDKKIGELIKKEVKRQAETIDLIASENIVSSEVLEALGSALTNKYSEGYPGKRYYPGNVYYDEIEEIAKARALRLFRLSPNEWQVNVQPYSGSPANMAVYTALVEPGETIMGMALSSGGHLTHGHKVSATGKFWRSVQYVVDEKSGLVDFEALKKLVETEKPKILVSGFTAYPREVNFKRFGEIAKAAGSYHLVDMSHIAGLIAGGMHPSPFPHADVVMTTTHKTLRGPRGAMIFSRKEISEKIDKAVFPGLQGGPHNNVTAAKAVAFYEALQPTFKKYAAQIVNNAKALAGALMKNGLTLVTGGTDTHLILADMRSVGLDGMTAEKMLEEVGIIANRNTVPGDPSPFKPSGVRIGTPSVTTRGMKEKEMKVIGDLIRQTLKDKKMAAVKVKVKKLTKKFPTP